MCLLQYVSRTGTVIDLSSLTVSGPGFSTSRTRPVRRLETHGRGEGSVTLLGPSTSTSEGHVDGGLDPLFCIVTGDT